MKPVIPTQYEPFKIYENKKEEPVFKIYEDKLEEETSVVLRDSKEKKELKTKQEPEAKLNKEMIKVEKTISVTCSSAVFLENMDISEKKKDDKPYLSDSPMSLEKFKYSISPKTEGRLSRRGSTESIFDMDFEYRSDIYSYLREAEVYTYLCTILICVFMSKLKQ